VPGGFSHRLVREHADYNDCEPVIPYCLEGQAERSPRVLPIVDCWNEPYMGCLAWFDVSLRDRAHGSGGRSLFLNVSTGKGKRSRAGGR